METRSYISDRRVGTRNLRPLPLDNLLDGTCFKLQALLEDDGWDMRKIICHILDTYSINVEYEDEDRCEPSVALVSRYFPRRPWTGRPTIFIMAQWTEGAGSNWAKAVQLINQKIKNRLRKSKINKEIDVEIIAPEQVLTKVLAPICHDEQLVSVWPSVSDEMDKILQDSPSTKGHVSAVSVFRMGYSHMDPTSNPVTIYIATDTTELHNGDWERVDRKIRALLDDRRLHDIKVHIEYNPSDLFTFELVEPVERPQVAQTWSDARLQIDEPYQRQVHLGGDFGVSIYFNRAVDGLRCNPGLGTIGCYIEMKSVRRPEWCRYVLTCYHVVRPAFDGFRLKPKRDASVGQGTNSILIPTAVDVPEPASELRRADEKGFGPNKRFERDLPTIEHPSRAKHNATVSRLRRIMAHEEQATQQALERGLGEARGTDKSAETTISATAKAVEKKIAFFDNGEQVVGKPYAGSGFLRRTPDGGALDWALLEIDASRQGTNMLPSAKAWERLMDVEDRPWSAACDTPLRPPMAAPSAAFTDGQKLFKLGARTGATSGTYSTIKTTCTMAESKYMNRSATKEHIIVGNPQEYGPFADMGDSGSIVFDNFGSAVGMVFTGHSPQGCSTQGYACVTPIQAILDDIVKFSHGTITDIRIAPPL